ncbi:hypothetical protein IFR05_012039 [Cadophora sp. M221]|nr:hypothetical protein IFR05_012039 [Cadophora sp. M221]
MSAPSPSGNASTVAKEGLTILFDGAGQVAADIVFVHGLNGDAIQTWTKDDVCWPRDLLPQDIANARIMTWGYDSKIARATSFSSQASIFGHCENLLFDLDIVRRGLSVPRPLIFVGHSLGGLVIKQAGYIFLRGIEWFQGTDSGIKTLIRSSEYLKNEQNPRLGAIIESTAGVVFIATPHNGSEAAPLAKLVANAAEAAWRRPNKKLLRNLSQESDVLEAQRGSFASVSRELQIRCIYEELPTMGFMIVPEYSAVMVGFNSRKIGIRANHHDVCHLEDFLHRFTQTLSFEELTARHDEISTAHAKTCEWVFSREDVGFTDWLSHGKDIFWIYGKPGSGKSTLMKFLLQNRTRLRQSFHPDGTSQVIFASFFFWSTGTTMQKSFAGLLRSLLFDIFTQAPQLVPVVFNQEIQQYWRNPNDIPEEWSLGRLYKAFRAISTQQDVSLRILLLIDGLDEFEGDHADRVKLLDLLLEVSSLEETQRAHFAVCAASRDENIFYDMLHHHPRLRIQDLTLPDIKMYVNNTLANNPRMLDFRQSNTVEVDAFESAIINKSSGVFLWVTLAVRSLLQGLTDRDTISELRARLEELPPKLHDLYMSMLRKIDGRHKEQARFVFGVVLLSPKPVSPLVISLAEDGPELAIQAPISAYEAENINARSREMEGRIRSRCAMLLEINELTAPSTASQALVSDRRTVSVIHKTVRDFFESPAGRGFLSTESETKSADPAVSLFSSYLRVLKIETDTEKTLENVEVVENVSILRKAGASTGHIQIEMMTELESVLYNIAACQPLHWSQLLPSTLNAKPHFWQSISQPNDETLQCSLDSFGVSMGLHVYIEERMLSQGLDPNDKLGKPLLRFATEINPVGYEEGSWKIPDATMVALLIKHGANVDTNWRGASVYKHAFLDICDLVLFRRRLLGVDDFFLHIPHLGVLQELLAAKAISDINVVSEWQCWAIGLMEGTPLDVLHNCLLQLKYEEDRNPKLHRVLFKESRARQTQLIECMIKRSASRLVDLPKLEADQTNPDEDSQQGDKRAEAQDNDTIRDHNPDLYQEDTIVAKESESESSMWEKTPPGSPNNSNCNDQTASLSDSDNTNGKTKSDHGPPKKRKKRSKTAQTHRREPRTLLSILRKVSILPGS